MANVTTYSGKLVIIDLGLPTVQYLWDGVEIPAVTGISVSKTQKLTINTLQPCNAPVGIREAGIVIKGVCS